MKQLPTLLSPGRSESIAQQMRSAGAIGFAKGCLIALTTGVYLNYQYNHGHNSAYFRTPYKVWYLVVWGIVGMTFETENAKSSIMKNLAIEEGVRRNQYLQEFHNNEVSNGSTGQDAVSN